MHAMPMNNEVSRTVRWTQASFKDEDYDIFLHCDQQALRVELHL